MATPTTKDQFKEYCLRTLGKPNKYINWYFNIVEKAIVRDWNKKTAPCYVEKHHIVPRSLGGSNIDIVCLTAKEHFICHILLTKFTVGKDKSKMCLALYRLINGNNKNYCNSSVLYEYSKILNSAACSERSKNYWKNFSKEQRSEMRSGEKNSRWGVTISGTETATKIGVANKGKLLGKNHPLYNKKHSQHSIEKMSKNRKGKTLGDKNGMFGKIGKAAGKKWYNDGYNEKYFNPGTEPKNWSTGRLKRNIV